MSANARIVGANQSQLTIGDLEAGTLFRVSEQMSDRLFVRCGDGLSTAYNRPGHTRRVGGRKIKDVPLPPSLAVVVPGDGTGNIGPERNDRRAFCPASLNMTADTPVIATYGKLQVNLGN